MADNNMLMGWDDVIESDGQEYVVLPEGDYNFTVTNVERGYFNGSPKVPACNQAILTLNVDGGEHGHVTVRANLLLYRSLEWKLAQFFRSIGQKKHGEKLVMNWPAVNGAHGRCHIKPRSYTGNDGMPRQANEIERYLDYDPTKMGFTVVKNEALPWDSEGAGF